MTTIEPVLAPMLESAQEPALVIACGALAREIQYLKVLNGWTHLKIRCIEADLHNRPEHIPGRVRAEIQRYRARYEHIFVAYMDCGTGGLLDRVLEEEGVERLPGAHCYASYAGQGAFAQMAEEELGSFYLTDFLARHFQRLVVKTLKLDQYPQLRDEFFGNYKRLVYLSQTQDAALRQAAEAAATYLGLEFQQIHTGYGELETGLVKWIGKGQASGNAT